MTADAPNVLFLIDDQHRYDWMGCAGAEFVRTPNLDALAARGMRFSNCFTNSPVCGPARCSLATGLLPTRLGVMGNDTSYLPISTPTMYKHFRDHGYRVSLVGRHDLAKWGAPASLTGDRPLNFSYGFTEALEVEGGMAVSGLDEPNGPYGAYLREVGWWKAYRDDYRARAAAGWILGASHDSVLPAEHHHDAFVASRAIERIEGIPRDYPWFMFVSFQGPHDPFDPPKEVGESYRDAEIPDPVSSDLSDKGLRTQRRRDARIAPGVEPNEEQVREARRQYAGKITWIDTQVGRILAALDRSGQADNTIVVFCSDHGEMAGDHELWIKHTAHEPSWRVPMILAGPGVERGTCDALVELSDVNPTLVELTGLPAQEALDAESFAACAMGRASEHRPHVMTVTGEPGFDTMAAIRTRDEKLVRNSNDRCELYDLREDPQELRNLDRDRPERVAELTREIVRRLNKNLWMR